MKNTKVLLLLTLLAVTINGYSQSEKPTYNIKLLGVFKNDTAGKKDVEAVFFLTPKKTEDFPPLPSLIIEYGINADTIQRISDQTTQGDKNVSFVIYSASSIRLVRPDLYHKIKDRARFQDRDNVKFYVFKFTSPADEEIEKIVIKYGPRERNEPRKRVVREYRAKVE